MLLRMFEECERRREEADQRRRADFKAAIDSWMPQEQKKAEDLQFLVEDEQSKVTPTTCSMECPNGSSPSTTARSIYDDEGATPTIILEVGDGEGKDRMPFIISKDLPELTPIMCLTKCSRLDVEPDFTVAAVVTCSNTAVDSKELVATDGATGTTIIDPVFVPRRRTPSVCCSAPMSTVSLIEAGVAYSLLLGAPEGIESSGKATLVMAQKLNSNFCLKWVALNWCSTKCSKGYKKLLMSHPKRNPWPPPCSGGVFHYVGGEEKVTEGMLYGLSTVSCNYLIIPAATMTTTFLSVPSSTQNIYGACWLEAQEGLNDIAKGRTYKICKSMRMTLNHVESWLQNPTNILYNGQLFNCPAGIHFGVRRISGIIARGAGENQNRKVKTCGYDSIFDFCENNPSDGSAAARFSIDGIDTRTDSEMIYASIANRDYWSVKLLEVIKEGCPIRHLLLGDIKKEQLLQCETFSTRQTNTEQVIKLQVSNSKEIQELQVPWDPGGFLHRLGDKPNFKKRGLSGTQMGCTWAAGYTTGWSAHRQEAQASPS
uniref:Uncharacterized protein n=1 Tax=Oryza glumipatula TaxID=40148 RepID=A0A0D9ZZ88_9ORYZ